MTKTFRLFGYIVRLSINKPRPPIIFGSRVHHDIYDSIVLDDLPEKQPDG